MTKIVIVLCAVIALTLGLPEKPAPYPAKGWKPQGARLELPREYGTPRMEIDDIEFTTMTNEYPTTTEYQSDENSNDVLRVQGLPAVDSVSQFRQFQQRKPANFGARPQFGRIQQASENADARQQIQQTPANVDTRQQFGRIQMAPAPAFANQPLLLSPLFAPQFAAVSGRLQERRFGRLDQAAEVNDPKNDVQQLPARAYGPPQVNNNNDETTPNKENDEPQVPQNEEPEQPQNDNEDEEEVQDDASDEPVVAVANSKSSGNLLQGQYYLLLPDQSLQKVRFATKQTNEDRQINGFSAQLRYSPVEAIKDPVFGYDQQGKLVRLFK